VILQEATRPQVVERLATDLGMEQWGARPRSSLGFLSRRPLVGAQWHKPRFSRHAFLEIVVAEGGVRLFGVHLSAVHAAWTERRRVYELRALLSAIRQHQSGPHALLGDFNTLAPGELLDVSKLPRRLRPFVWVSGGRVRWRTIQTVLDAEYVDAFRALHPDVVGSTFPTHAPHLRLDYVFVPGGWIGNVRSCSVVTTPPADSASDHFPLCVELDA
jgi:endonuclease/exonuclease/phosphatase family metal-dependent hydrolase